MALLTTTVVGPAGVVDALVAANAGGDTFIPDDNTWIEVNNASGGSINVTIPVFQGGSATTELGDAVSPHIVAVGAGVRKKIGPLKPRNVLNPATGTGAITYSASASVTVGAFRM